jgi:L-xylulokinase
MTKYLMGIDNGSTAIKAGIYDLQGNEISVAGAKCEMVSPEPGFYERDMEGIWQGNVEAVSKAIKKAGIDARDIAAVSLTGHGNGLYLVDAEGRPVQNAIAGMDGRGLSIAERWTRDGTFEKIHPRAMQALFSAHMVCEIAWMKENRPEALDRTRWVFTVLDWVRYRLTGEAHGEMTTLSGGGVVNIGKCSYDRELMELMGIGPVYEKLPPLAQSTELCGKVTAEASKHTGLAEGTPVIAGLYDIDSAGIAAGMIDETKWNVIVGTWCNNQFISGKPVVSRDFFSTTVYAKPGYFLMLEGSPTSASNLEWFVREFLQKEKVEAEHRGASVYDICNEAVKDTRPEEADIVFVPFLYGSNANPKAKAVFIGLEGWHRREHLIRAIYEGICFSHRYHIEKIEKLQKRPDAVRIAGGAARSRVWVQMFADVLQMPMEITAVEELGTLGAAMCAGVGTGLFPDFDKAVEAMVKLVRRVEPDPSQAEVYARKYARYKKAISSLDGFWD